MIKKLLNQMFGKNNKPGYPISLNEQISPVFIIGSGRSGNTLLRRILTGGPELYIPPETYVLGRIIKQFKKNSSLGWSEQCNLALGTFSNSEDFETFPTPYLHELFGRLSELPEEDRALSKIVAGFYEHMMQSAKPSATRWGDKTPMNSSSLYRIKELFPKAKFVHIYRNGYDVVSSYLKMGRYMDAEEAAKRWVTALDDCHRFALTHPDAVIEVKYETLCESPKEIAPAVCSFLELGYSEDMVTSTEGVEHLGDISARSHYSNVTKPINVSSIGKGRDSFDESTLERLMPIMSETMRSFGYQD